MSDPLAELKKSVSEMTDEELTAAIRSLRAQREVAPKRRKAKKEVKVNLKNLSMNDITAILEHFKSEG